METRLARSSASLEKLTDEKTIKMTEGMKRFCEARARQQGMESSADYIRGLIAADQTKAAHDLSLLADALGAKVTVGNVENHSRQSGLDE
jgi:hypothetical protein